MTSIERTAYPQFRRLTSARVLHVFFTPTAEEIGWAKERTAARSRRGRRSAHRYQQAALSMPSGPFR